MRLHTKAVLALLCSATFSTVALAQTTADESPATAAPQAGEPGVGDIVVTARKRSESLNRVPIAVSAFSGDTLAKQGITDLAQVSNITPGLKIKDFSPSRPILTLRGISTVNFDIGVEGSIGVFEDEVYDARASSTSLGLFDLARIEVLKGPQGTLFGRNTIGGAIHFITNNPTNAFEYRGQLTVGNYNLRRTEAMVSGPIVDGVLAARLAGAYESRDGYYTNLTTGHSDDKTYYALRGKLLFTPSSNFTANLAAEYFNDKRDANLRTALTDGQRLQAPPPFANPALGLASPGPRTVYQNRDGLNDREVYRLSAHLNWTTDRFAVTSITGYQHGTMAEQADNDATQLFIEETTIKETTRQFNQELRLSSVPGGVLSFGDRVNWLLGAYYFNDRGNRADRYDYGRDALLSALAVNRGSLSCVAINPASCVIPAQPFNQTITLALQTDSFALFGQAEIKLSEQLGLTLGGRYTRDHKHFLNVVSGSVAPAFVKANDLTQTSFTVDTARTWTSFDPKITLDYKPSRQVLLYATYSTGFKSGGFQFGNQVQRLAQILVQPEEVKSYEVGAKLTLLGGNLQINGSAYHLDYKNLAFLRPVTLVAAVGGGVAPTTENAASSRINGLELELRARPTRHFDIDVGYAYTDGKYTDFQSKIAAGIEVGTPPNFTGVDLPRTPHHTLNASGEYRVPVADLGEIAARVDWSYTASYLQTPGDAAFVQYNLQPSYGLLNASLRYRTQNGRFEVSIWGKNLTKTNYLETILPFRSPPNSDTIGIYNAPRTFGLTLKIQS